MSPNAPDDPPEPEPEPSGPPEPTLGERAASLRKVVAPVSRGPRSWPPRPGPSLVGEPGAAWPSAAATTRALGAGLGLLLTFVAAIAFAFVMSRLVGGTYITFAMPIFVGTLIAALASIGPKRFRFGERRPLIMMMIAGAVVCWIGQHALAYLRVVDIVAAQRGLTGPDAASTALATLEDATGASGFFAYLSYVSSGAAATLSPIGFLGRAEPGVAGTILIALAELGLMAATASWSMLYRTRAARRAPSGPLAFFDTAASIAAGEALQFRRFDELAAIVAASTGPVTHALAIEEGESTAEASIHELDGHGNLGPRVRSRLMPIAASHALRAALDRRRGGADGPRDA